MSYQLNCYWKKYDEDDRLKSEECITNEFDTERELLEFLDEHPMLNSQDVRKEIKQISNTLTLEQLQEKLDNETPQELQEVEFQSRKVAVGDLIYFEREMWDERDCEYYYTDYYGRVLRIIKQYNNVKFDIEMIAFESGTLIREYNEKGYRKVDTDLKEEKIHSLHCVCTPEYFDRIIEKEQDKKKKKYENLMIDYENFCFTQDKQIEKINVLKGML